MVNTHARTHDSTCPHANLCPQQPLYHPPHMHRSAAPKQSRPYVPPHSLTPSPPCRPPNMDKHHTHTIATPVLSPHNATPHSDPRQPNQPPQRSMQQHPEQGA
ncbi:hypothetical protein K439DRAFT_1373424 [Ramaria rubella]|nr:hypothetical protein K439DRAFT_1373424 [Ramaria rubella]